MKPSRLQIIVLAIAAGIGSAALSFVVYQRFQGPQAASTPTVATLSPPDPLWMQSAPWDGLNPKVK
ncbi:hypothetical protein DO97_07170 [Neosynechococcus sphagnicola sy1]|uniref:Uncharacterized protein n=1 Tax=Neosynechococcus sphagnicola sy1 TaxID=1497020 RepID=A0A098TJZ5_9CYAN|nr:hypothetical protein [Neosynechococcus sphagnicola]KGF72624.1 hypothetical protein DO97_07170 [Neosynechococcus sphagnicola sy1]